MPEVIAKVLLNQRAGKTDYLSRGNVAQALEGRQRALFAADAANLKRQRAASYLRGPEHEDRAHEIIVSPAAETYELLGATRAERTANLVAATRQAMARLQDELGVSARWVGALHENRAQKHLHLLVSSAVTGADGQPATLNRFPPEFFQRQASGNLRLGDIFAAALRARWQLRPGSTPTLQPAPNAAVHLPALAESGRSAAYHALVERAGLVPGIVQAAFDNGSVAATATGQPVFVRRDATGRVTGAVWRDAAGARQRTGTGWFYVGNLNMATRFVLVDNPVEALALQSLSSGRDLRRVAFVALNGEKLDRDLARRILQRQQDALHAGPEPVRVVWARGNGPDGQKLRGEPDWREHLARLSQLLESPAPAFARYAPRPGNRTWLAQLEAARQSAEYEGLVTGRADPHALAAPQADVTVGAVVLPRGPVPDIPTLPPAADVLDGTRQRQIERAALQTSADGTHEEPGAPAPPPLYLPTPSPAHRAPVRFYLEEERGLQAATLNRLEANGTLYANSFGSAVFVQRDAEGRVTGASWRAATPGDTRRGTSPGSSPDVGWFYLGDLRAATRYMSPPRRLTPFPTTTCKRKPAQTCARRPSSAPAKTTCRRACFSYWQAGPQP